MTLGMEILERKFIQQYGGMTEREFWWFVEQTLKELTEERLLVDDKDYDK